MFFYFLFCSVVKTYVNASAGKMARIYIEIIIMSTLLLNEQAYTQLSDVQKPMYILEWLRHLESVLVNVSRVSINLSISSTMDV